MFELLTNHEAKAVSQTAAKEGGDTPQLRMVSDCQYQAWSPLRLRLGATINGFAMCCRSQSTASHPVPERGNSVLQEAQSHTSPSNTSLSNLPEQKGHARATHYLLSEG
jgi:hypothetical protein